MNEYLGAFLDANLADHWPDIVMAAFVAFGFWILERSISRNESRHQRAEDKFVVVDDKLGKHEIRITKMEVVAEERERRREK